MTRESLYLTFQEITEEDIPSLAVVITRAFDDDARKHSGQGPCDQSIALMSASPARWHCKRRRRTAGNPEARDEFERG